MIVRVVIAVLSASILSGSHPGSALAQPGGSPPTAPASPARGQAAEEGLRLFRQGSFAEAHRSWLQAATANDATSELYLAITYDAGLGVAQDDAQAMAWYRRAAAHGSVAAAFNIGVLNDSGVGIPRDAAQAATWYAQAAASGFGRAEYNLGLMYETGDGVPRDRARAVALFTSAAGHGITAARDHLVRLGQVVPAAARAPVVAKPVDTALDQFRAAQALLLARRPTELAQAVVLFRAAAQRGNALAAYDLAYCYEKGIGVARDLDQAATWYRQAVRDAVDADLKTLAATGLNNLVNSQRQSPVRPSAAR